MSKADMKQEGYWRSEREPNLPMPVPSNWPGRVDFIQRLTALESTLKPILYRGWSTCRVCGKGNGIAEFQHDGWRWPSGFMHYLLSHGVRPTPAFEAMVTGEPVSAMVGSRLHYEKKGIAIYSDSTGSEDEAPGIAIMTGHHSIVVDLEDLPEFLEGIALAAAAVQP